MLYEAHSMETHQLMELHSMWSMLQRIRRGLEIPRMGENHADVRGRGNKAWHKQVLSGKECKRLMPLSVQVSRQMALRASAYEAESLQALAL